MGYGSLIVLFLIKKGAVVMVVRAVQVQEVSGGKQPTRQCARLVIGNIYN